MNDNKSVQQKNHDLEHVFPKGNAMKGHLTSANNPLITPDAVMMNELYNDKNQKDRMKDWDVDNGRLNLEQQDERDFMKKGDLQNEQQFGDIMDVKKQFGLQEQAYANRAINREKKYAADMKSNPKNVPFAGGTNFKNKTSNLASDDNPLSNIYSESAYTQKAAQQKETIKNEYEIVDIKARGNPKGLLFSNNCSEGNPMDTLDKSMVEYYKNLNKKLVAQEPMKGSHKRNANYNPRTDGQNKYGSYF